VIAVQRTAGVGRSDGDPPRCGTGRWRSFPGATRFDASRSAIYVILTALYRLFSPRTENNTYAMLGPSIAVFLSLAFLAEKRSSQGIFLASLVAVLVGNRPISNALTPHTEISWIPPLMAACFAAYLFFPLYRTCDADTRKSLSDTASRDRL
jgi:hypothetical protein